MIALTGEQVHAAYNKVLRDEKYLHGMKFPQSTIRKWDDLSSHEKELYNGLAIYLNVDIAQMEVSK